MFVHFETCETYSTLSTSSSVFEWEQSRTERSQMEAQIFQRSIPLIHRSYSLWSNPTCRLWQPRWLALNTNTGQTQTWRTPLDYGPVVRIRVFRNLWRPVGRTHCLRNWWDGCSGIQRGTECFCCQPIWEKNIFMFPLWRKGANYNYIQIISSIR